MYANEISKIIESRSIIIKTKNIELYIYIYIYMPIVVHQCIYLPMYTMCLVIVHLAQELYTI